ncbi:hypothetical protein MNBD_ALPHA12-1352 [hydrothermal vent metagenome]|uniref:Peptidase S54 rhomboid domain-containing protein n=1 Tax=hydrothermal vent metagenome TaxID=652676 RepID=A0A3B0UUF0_9ZZZZ
MAMVLPGGRQNKEFDQVNYQADNPRPAGDERQPVFLLPNSVAILAMSLLVVHAAYEWALGPLGQRLLVLWFGFIPSRLDHVGLPGGVWAMVWTPFTYALVHASWTHVLLNVAWLLAFATPVARRYGGAKMLVVFFIGSAGGALAFMLVQQGPDIYPLVGASGGISALMGTAMRFVFEPVEVARHEQTGMPVVVGRRLASFSGMLKNSRARAFILFWVGINLAIPVYALFAGPQGMMVAWQAHLGGFAVGLVLPGLFEFKNR